MDELLVAASNNDKVKIAAGTYTGINNVGKYIQKILTFEKYGDGEVIFDGQHGGSIWSVGVDTINIYGLTFINGGGNYGGALYFMRDLSNSVINATFINNSVSIYGGAIYVDNSVSNLTLRSTFINNTANEYGGAVYIKSTASNLILNSTFIGNTAGNKGAAVYIGEAADNVKVYGEFINNNGGDSIIYIGNSVSGNSIHDSVFLNNKAYKIFSVNGGEITAKDNWFGNNASNYYKIPEDVGIDLENWLFLNATANPSKLNPGEKSAITFKLSSFEGSEISDYDASKMNIALDLSQTHGQLDKTSAPIGETITYTAKEGGAATVTGKFETASYTVGLTNVDSRQATSITAADVSATYKVNKNLVITLKDAKGKAIANAKVTVNLNGAKTYTTDKNGQVKVSTKGLAPKKYSAKVTFNGNANYLKSSKTVKVTVKKATPKLTAKKKTFKSSTKTKKYAITLKDNTGKAIKKAKVTLKVKGKTYKATTNSKGKATFKIKKLNKKGTFKATVTYKGNKYYNKVSKKAKIKVTVTFKTVSKGSKDKATVMKIQTALKNKGYYTTYKGHYLKVDGKFSKNTVKALKQFQKDKGLKVTGKVDEKTAKKLGII